MPLTKDMEHVNLCGILWYIQRHRNQSIGTSHQFQIFWVYMSANLICKQTVMA
jgi:hypothetical protein